MNRLPPALIAFLVHWAGLLAGGLLGPVHALAAGLGIAGLAATALCLQRLRPSRFLVLIATLWMTGPLSLALRAEPDIPGAGLPPPPDPVRCDVEVQEVLRQDPLATVALVRVERFDDPSGMARLPGDGLVVLQGPGGLDLWRSRTLALRARWVPPPAPPESLGPRWPTPPDRPRLIAQVSSLVPLEVPGRRDLGAWDRLRQRLGGSLTQDLGEREAALALAVTIGEGRAVPGDLRADLADLGTAHILCVSGLHVTIAAWIAGLLLTRLLGPLLVRLRPQGNLLTMQRVASLGAALAFAALAGFPVSALRAAGMFGVGTLGALLGRPSSLPNSLGLAGLADLLLRPSDAFDLSFDLSYGALLGLALLAPREPPPRSLPLPRRLLARFLQGLRTSLAATLGTTPWTVLFFGQASLVAPLANLVVLPAFSLAVMPAILARLLLASLAPEAASLTAPLLQGLLHAFLDLQSGAAAFVPALRNPSPAAFLATCGSMALLWALLLLVPPRLLWVPVVLGLWVGAAARPGEDRPPPGSLVLEVLAIGKGDALLVQCPDGDRWLVDAGEARTSARLLSHLRSRGIRSLRGLVLTHADEDHVGGAAALLRGVSVREVRVSRPVVGDSPLREVLEGAPEVPVLPLQAGDEAIPACGDPSPVLWPPPGEALHGNGASLVFALGLAGRRILLTGDLEAPEEARLLDQGRVPRADVLKLGHHGSPGSSSEAFLEAVRPRFALVSGYRTRRHRTPSRETRRRVEAVGALWLDSASLGGLRVVLTPAGEVSAGGRRTPGPWLQGSIPGRTGMRVLPAEVLAVPLPDHPLPVVGPVRKPQVGQQAPVGVPRKGPLQRHRLPLQQAPGLALRLDAPGDLPVASVAPLAPVSLALRVAARFGAVDPQHPDLLPAAGSLNRHRVPIRHRNHPDRPAGPRPGFLLPRSPVAAFRHAPGPSRPLRVAVALALGDMVAGTVPPADVAALGVHRPGVGLCPGREEPHGQQDHRPPSHGFLPGSGTVRTVLGNPAASSCTRQDVERRAVGQEVRQRVSYSIRIFCPGWGMQGPLSSKTTEFEGAS